MSLSSFANAYLIKGTYQSQPGPGASVAQANFSGGSALPPGTYLIIASAYFGPAVAPVDGTDNDNLTFEVDGVSVGGHLLLPAIQNSLETWTFPAVTTLTGAVKLQTIGAATAGVVYRTALYALTPG